MARYRKTQNSFNGGELSPKMRGRTDTEKYDSSVEELENFLITPEGALVKRPGFVYVASGTGILRLIPFIYSDGTAYVFGIKSSGFSVYTAEGQLAKQDLVWQTTTDMCSEVTDEFYYEGHGYVDQDGPGQFTAGTPSRTTLNTDRYIKIPGDLTFVPGDVSTTNDTITETSHGLSHGMGPFRVKTTGILPTGLKFDTDYYISEWSTNAFRLSEQRFGGVVDITAAGEGTHTLFPTEEYKRNVFRISATPGGAAIAPGGIPISDVVTTFSLNTADTVDVTWPASEYPYYAAFSVSGAAAAEKIQYAQVGDVMYLALEDKPPVKIERTSAAGFSCEHVLFEDGPYLDENPTSVTLLASATTGSNETLTASSALFTQGDAGRLVRILSDDGSGGTPHWGYARIEGVEPLAFADADFEQATYNAAGVNGGTDIITTTAAHNMDTGEAVTFEAVGTLDSGVTAGTLYYVNAQSTTTLSFHTTPADAFADTNRVNLAADGTGTPEGNINSSVIDITAHGYSGGEGPFQLTTDGTLPGGFSGSKDYFIVYASSDSFALSEDKNGTPVAPTTFNTGNHYANTDDASVPFAKCRIIIKQAFDTTATTGSGVATWALGAFGGDASASVTPNPGYPSAVSFHEQRLWFAGTNSQPQTVFASRINSFEEFSPTGEISSDTATLDDTVTDSNGIVSTIAAGDVNRIRWISSSRSMLIGTQKRIWEIRAPSTSSGLSPANIEVIPTGAPGASVIQPVIAEGRPIYVSDSRHRVYSAGYDFNSDSYIGEDLTVFADHILEWGGNMNICYAQQRWPTVYCTIKSPQTATGSTVAQLNEHMAALTLYGPQQVSGWSKIRFGTDGNEVVGDNSTMGIKSAAVIPREELATDWQRYRRPYDQVWVLAGIQGLSSSICYMEAVDEYFDLLADLVFLDAAVIYQGVSTSTITGLDHLEGLTVRIMSAGEDVGTKVVSSGSITLDAATTNCVVGLPYTAKVKSLRQNVPTNEGEGETSLGRIDHLAIRLNNSVGGDYGTDSSNTYDLGDKLLPLSYVSGVRPRFTGEVEVSMRGAWDTPNQWYIEHSEPFPFTIVAVTAMFTKGRRGERS